MNVMKVKIRYRGQGDLALPVLDGIETVFPNDQEIIWISRPSTDPDTIIITVGDDVEARRVGRDLRLFDKPPAPPKTCHVFPRFRLIEERDF